MLTLKKQNPANNLRILIIDEAPVIEYGLHTFFQKNYGQIKWFSVTGRDHLFAHLKKLKPTVLIIDPFATAQELNLLPIRKLYPSLKIIVLSNAFTARTILTAMEQGADVFVTRKTSFDEWKKAIKNICNGEKYLPENWMAMLPVTLLNGTDKRKRY